MRQSPSGREVALPGCGAAHTKARPPTVVMAPRAAMATAKSERCMEPPCKLVRKNCSAVRTEWPGFLAGKLNEKSGEITGGEKALRTGIEPFSRGGRRD